MTVDVNPMVVRIGQKNGPSSATTLQYSMIHHLPPGRKRTRQMQTPYPTVSPVRAKGHYWLRLTQMVAGAVPKVFWGLSTSFAARE